LSTLRSGQARPTGCVSWLEPIDDSRLVYRSVENWTATSVCASLRWQQQYHSQATPSTAGRPHMCRRLSTLAPTDSWIKIIVVQRLCNVRPVPARMKTIMVLRLCYIDPVPGMAQFTPKLFKSCHVHFQH